ncbi:MAG: hypothetical protein M3P06_19060 [Acidobacteriota bacterium]|nr:hypothetical protein [Acidobacteriota bacterium]
MKLALLLLVMFVICGCRSASVGCERCIVDVPTDAELGDVPPASELHQALRRVLTALALCDPHDPALDRAGLENPYTSGQKPVTYALQCLRVVRWTRTAPTEMAFFMAPLLKNGRVGDEDLIMIGTWDGQRWQFSWPAVLGPPEIR